jgi:hypothetical protein
MLVPELALKVFYAPAGIEEIRRTGVAHPMRFEFLDAPTPADLLHPLVQIPVGRWVVPAIHEDCVSPLGGRAVFSQVLGQHIPDLVADIDPVAFLFLSTASARFRRSQISRIMRGYHGLPV